MMMVEVMAMARVAQTSRRRKKVVVKNGKLVVDWLSSALPRSKGQA